MRTENVGFAQHTVSKKCQVGIFETSRSVRIMASSRDPLFNVNAQCRPQKTEDYDGPNQTQRPGVG